MFFHFKLQYLLFLAFTLIASLPVTMLAYWVQRVALEKEVNAVKEKHLLVAKNVTRDLNRYVTDVESSIQLITSNLILKNKIDGVAKHLETLDIRYIYITDNKGNINMRAPQGANLNSKKIDNKLWATLQSTIDASKKTKKIVFSHLIRTGKNETTFFIIKYLNAKQIAVSALSTHYIKSAQKEISFGRRGHVAIVDKLGHAIAHPVPEWVKSMKDMSFLPPVKRMMAGKTGVIKFYTPAMQGDVIAGYTIVKKTGWGVMVPQPFKELEEHASSNQHTALIITLFGIFIAGLISWNLSRLLIRPIHSVIEATNFSERDNQKIMNIADISKFHQFIPKEIEELISSFNHMTKRLNTMTDQLYSKIDFANKEVKAQNLKLKNQAHELIKINKELEILSTTDNLTSLFNRRLFDEISDTEMAFSKRHDETLSLVILDIDKFKSINDQYGHIQGDRVLAEIAKIIKNQIRLSDIGFRIGGEEFAILLRKTNYDESKIMIEGLRQVIAQYKFSYKNKIFTVTSSFGIMTIPDKEISIDNMETFYRFADQAMYYSKEHGRNKVTHYHDISS